MLSWKQKLIVLFGGKIYCEGDICVPNKGNIGYRRYKRGKSRCPICGGIKKLDKA